MDVNVLTYEPDGTTLRETYAMAPLEVTDAELVIRGLRFRVSAAGGMGGFTLTIYKEASTVTTVEGDILKVEVDGTVRYVGKISSMDVDKSDTDSEYEDKIHVRGGSIIELADSIPYTLREENGGTVSTTLQELLDDLFDGGQYSDKGQDNNQSIETALSPMLTYSPANNVLEALNINASFNGTSAAEVMDYVMRLNNGTLDLTSVEPYGFRVKTDKTFHAEQRVTTLLETFDMDDGDFPTRNSVDLADDGYRTFVEGRTSIANKFILNGNELTSLQYGAEVGSSRAAWGTITAAELNNENITIEEGQKWLDGFILDMLGKITMHELRLRRSKYGFAPVWFTGSTDTTNGYIRLTEGGSSEVFNEPFIDAEYRLDSGGWDIIIRAGQTRPNYAARAEVLTTLTGLKTFAAQTPTIIDPSDSADDETFSGTEIFDYGQFNWVWDNTDYDIAVTDVVFKIKIPGGDWWPGGTEVKALTSTTTPAVAASGIISNMFICRFFNATSGTRNVSGGTVHPLNLATETQYEMWVEATIDKGGGSLQIIKTPPAPFYLTGETTGKKARDSKSRMPDAEDSSTQGYTPVATLLTAKFKFFTNTGGNDAPDAGAVGWFITSDDSGSWVRMNGDFAGNLTGTTNGSFTADSDDSEASYIYYNFGTGGAGLRLNISTSEVEVNHQDGGEDWVSLATGASTFIEDTYSAEDYRLVVDSSTGNLKYIRDFGGTPLIKFEVTPNGDIISYGDIEPDTDDSGTSLGTSDKMWSNTYCANVTYTQDITFTSDGGTTVDGKLETTNNVVYPEGIAFGFQDD